VRCTDIGWRVWLVTCPKLQVVTRLRHAYLIFSSDSDLVNLRVYKVVVVRAIRHTRCLTLFLPQLILKSRQIEFRVIALLNELEVRILKLFVLEQITDCSSTALYFFFRHFRLKVQIVFLSLFILDRQVERSARDIYHFATIARLIKYSELRNTIEILSQNIDANLKRGIQVEGSSSQCSEFHKALPVF